MGEQVSISEKKKSKYVSVYLKSSLFSRPLKHTKAPLERQDIQKWSDK